MAGCRGAFGDQSLKAGMAQFWRHDRQQQKVSVPVHEGRIDMLNDLERAYNGSMVHLDACGNAASAAVWDGASVQFDIGATRCRC
jgi:hypothetical protein